jgi:hypothetical protein
MAKVMVLGAGPAGLLAAHAGVRAGLEVVIFSSGAMKSTMYGAQYLHRDIPGVPCGVPHEITVRLTGTAEDYRKKVYGDSSTGPVSPTVLGNPHLAWNIRQAYDWLWEKYSPLIEPLHLMRESASYFYDHSLTDYDFHFSTIPLRQLCATGMGEQSHNWESQQIFAIGDAPELGIMCPIPTPDFTLEYNGTSDVGWYRAARIFGHTTCEWPAHGRRPPLMNLASVTKPLSTTCTCFPRWQRLGRYGKWKKGVLAHHAFEEVEAYLASGVQGALFERP